MTNYTALDISDWDKEADIDVGNIEWNVFHQFEHYGLKRPYSIILNNDQYKYLKYEAKKLINSSDVKNLTHYLGMKVKVVK